MLGTDWWTPFFNQMPHGVAELAPEVRSWQWKERVLDSQRPVMVHLWSKAYVPTRSEALAPVIDEVVRTFDGKIDAVRGLGVSPCNCACTAAHMTRMLPSPATISSLRRMLTPCVTQYSLAYETSPNAAQFQSSFLPSVIFFKVGHQNMCAHETLTLIALRA